MSHAEDSKDKDEMKNLLSQDDAQEACEAPPVVEISDNNKFKKDKFLKELIKEDKRDLKKL